MRGELLVIESPQEDFGWCKYGCVCVYQGRCKKNFVWLGAEVKRSRPSGKHVETSSLLKIQKISWAWWHVPVIPATQEGEAGELLEPTRRRLRWAKIAPLHSSLGNNSETPPQKKGLKSKARKYETTGRKHWGNVLGHWFRLAQSFWIRPQKHRQQEQKLQMGLHQAEKLLHPQENSQQMGETIYRMEENMCKLFLW